MTGCIFLLALVISLRDSSIRGQLRELALAKSMISDLCSAMIVGVSVLGFISLDVPFTDPHPNMQLTWSTAALLRR